jgi:hypothetical protein
MCCLLFCSPVITRSGASTRSLARSLPVETIAPPDMCIVAALARYVKAKVKSAWTRRRKQEAGGKLEETGSGKQEAGGKKRKLFLPPAS